MKRAITLTWLGICIIFLTAVVAKAGAPTPTSRQAVRILYDDGSSQEIATSQPAPVVVRPKLNAMGWNLDSIKDWSTSDAFIDIWKGSRGFGTWDSPESVWLKDATGQPTIPSIPRDPKGWPLVERSGVLFYIDRNPAEIAGTHKLIVKGKVTPTLHLAGQSTITNLAYDASTDTTTANVNVAGTGQLRIRFDGLVKPGSKLLRPGYESDEDIFTARHLRLMRTVGAIRFMDWLGTNDSTIVKWSDRITPEHVTWRSGVPWEVCIELCNRLNVDGWFCLPLMADDDYIRNAGLLLDKQLKPGLVPIVEVSNEVWNGIFKQNSQNREMVRALVASGNGQRYLDAHPTNIGFWEHFHYADLTVRAKKLMGPRVFVVLSGQHGFGRKESEYGYWLRQNLEFINKNHGHPKQFIGAIAVAPYYSLGGRATTQPITAEEYNRLVEQSNTTNDSRFRTQVALADKWELQFWAYEGGPHDVSPLTWTEVHRAQRGAESFAGNKRYLDNFFLNGGDRFFWFVAVSRWDHRYTWGATDNPDNLETGKIKAVIESGKEHPYN